MRRSLVVANWKMNGSRQQVQQLLSDLLPRLQDLGSSVECVVCPPFTYLDMVSEISESSNLFVGAQNLANSLETAFTGEISPLMLVDFGCVYVIIGHSERRQKLLETDEIVAAKFQIAADAGLQPILCVGETKQQMDAGQGFAVVERQVLAVIQQVGIEKFNNAVIAYEPVWAIGTGLTATPQDAQKMHAHIRAIVARFDAGVADGLRIIYGGSVNAANAAALFQEADIDGGLIGGASLKAQDFSEICHAPKRRLE